MKKYSRSHQEKKAQVKGRDVSFIEQTEIALDNIWARKHSRSHQVQSHKLLKAERQKTYVMFSLRAVSVAFLKDSSRILIDFFSAALKVVFDDVE